MFYEDIANSVTNILLLITVVVFCVGVLIYIFVRNQNRRVRQVVGTELYEKLFMFKKNQALFEKKTTETGRGQLILAKINNIDFLKELYGEVNVEKYVAKIGEKLGKNLPAGFHFGRISLSEFLIYSNDEKPEAEARRQIIEIFNIMKETVNLNEISVNSNFNMGVAFMSGGNNPSEELLRRATIAMWFSRRQGPNTFAYYTTEIDEKLIKEDEIQKELNKAIEQNQFRLHYQPIMDTTGNSIYGFEALRGGKKRDDCTDRRLGHRKGVPRLQCHIEQVFRK
jgi:cyclic di-GMP phosphodiesterase Gmr